MKRIFLAVVFLSFFLAACEDSAKDSQGECNIENNQYAPTRVYYKYNEDQTEISFERACDWSEFWYGNDYALTVTWCCADYQDCDNCYVSLTWWDWGDDGMGLVLEDAYISDGICDEECL